MYMYMYDTEDPLVRGVRQDFPEGPQGFEGHGMFGRCETDGRIYHIAPAERWAIHKVQQENYDYPKSDLKKDVYDPFIQAIYQRYAKGILRFVKANGGPSDKKVRDTMFEWRLGRVPEIDAAVHAGVVTEEEENGGKIICSTVEPPDEQKAVSWQGGMSTNRMGCIMTSHIEPSDFVESQG